ncbi:MAG: hypothetical protein AB7T63_13655 [Planctomycetota bacterium]
MSQQGSPREPTDRLAPWAGQGLAGFVQRARREALDAARLLDVAHVIEGKPGVYVSGDAGRFVRRIDVAGRSVLVTVTRPSGRAPRALETAHHHVALRAVGLGALEPWLALEGVHDRERVGVLMTSAPPGPTLEAWLAAGPSRAARRERADDVGRALRALHTARFTLPRVTAWTVALAPRPGWRHVVFVDLASLRRLGRRLSLRAVARDLAALDVSLGDLVSDRERLRALRAWLGGTLDRARPWLRRLERVRRQLAGKPWLQRPTVAS